MKDNQLKLTDHTYWDSNVEFQQVVAPIVCEPKWDGENYEFRSDNREVAGLKIKSIQTREADWKEPFGLKGTSKPVTKNPLPEVNMSPNMYI